MKVVYITIIAACIYYLSAEIFYINFEMEAWARGMERTSSIQRIIASLLLLIPIFLLGKLGYKILRKKDER